MKFQDGGDCDENYYSKNSKRNMGNEADIGYSITLLGNMASTALTMSLGH